MAAREKRPRQPYRTIADLERAVKAIARHFGTNEVYVVGSQATLVADAASGSALTISDEIDLYPGNAEDWERRHPGFEASEEIFALFGELSPFSDTYGFYIDGVDEMTAILPSDWKSRWLVREIIDGGRVIKAIAPSFEDLSVSKLRAFRDKDAAFVEQLAGDKLIDLQRVAALFQATNPPPALSVAVMAFLDDLQSTSGD